jgi:hypothetical protein
MGYFLGINRGINKMSDICKTIDGEEYLLLEGGYTKGQAEKRVQELKRMHIKARTLLHNWGYAVFIRKYR